MAINEQATVTIDINSANAQQRLNTLQQQAQNLSAAIKKAYEAGDSKTAKQLTSELKKTNAELKQVQKSTENLNAAMAHISTATPKELKAILAAINRELNSGAVKRGSKEWQDYNQKLIAVKAELTKINAEQKAAEPLMDRMRAGVSRFKGAIVGIGASITGIVAATASMRDYAQKKDTARAGLQALTGLDDESVAWLQQQAETMSQVMDETGLRVTQSADEVLQAYMLVGSAKPELLGVKEDLNAVTVEAIRLSQAAGIELQDAVAAVTTSMNQFGAGADRTAEFVNVLAAGSKAGAVGVANINEAVVKSGVAASQAGLSIQDLTAAIETVGERGLQGAKAGTGLSSFFLNLATGADETNPKIVGMSQALKNLADQHLTEAEMVKRFGKETYNVASILINSSAAFDNYKEAVTDTNTAVEQAAIMGDTAAARTAQLKNQIAEIGQKIYADIQPVVDKFLDGSATMLKMVAALVSVFKNYGVAILAVVAPLAAYNVALALSNVLHSKAVVAIAQYIKSLFSMATLEKAVTAGKYLLAAATALLTGNIKRASIAFKAFSRVLAMNPIGLVAAAIAAVVVGLIAWTRRTKELTQAQKNRQAVAEMNAEIEKKVNDQTADEISKIERLKTAIHNKNLSEKSRLKAIQDLQKIIPGYNAQISKEGDIINENTAALDNYIAAIKQAARAKAAEELLTSTIKEKLDTERSLEENRHNLELERQAYEAWENGIEVDNAEVQALIDKNSILWGAGYHVKAMRQLTNDNKALTDQLSQLDAKEKALLKMIAKDQETGVTTPTGVPEAPTEGGTGGKRDASAIELEAERQRLAAEKAFAANQTTYAQYQTRLLDIDKWVINQKAAIYEQGTKEYIANERERIALAKKYADLNSKLIQTQAEQDKAALTRDYANGLMTYTDYQSRTTDIELEALRQRQALYKNNQQEYADLQKQIDEKLNQQNANRVAVIRSQMEAENEAIKQELAMRLAQGLMTEDEYNEAIFQNEVEYLTRLREQYSVYANEYIEITKRIKDAEVQHQTEAAQRYRDNLRAFNNQYTDKGAVAEYNSGVASINQMQSRGDITAEAAQRAKTDLGAKLLDQQVKLIQAGNNSIVDTYKARYEAIENLERQGVIDHAEAEKQKLAATTDMLGQITDIYESAWGSINTVMQASSNLIQANADLETAKIEAEYDKRIDAAGRNRRKVEKLEKERDEKLRAMKTQANEKAMKIELAGAIAQTAVAAINAYSSAAAIPVAGFVLGPIAAAAALAAGAIQIATIKKQQQAEAAGYAVGGFTPNGRWDEPQGIVHSNEFVANRFAVGNPAIRPALDLIDRAQRNNTVGSLTAEDVTASLYSRTSPDVVAAVGATQAAVEPAAATQAANTAALDAAAGAIAANADALRRLSDQLDEGITAIASIDGRNGINHQQERYNQLLNNAR